MYSSQELLDRLADLPRERDNLLLALVYGSAASDGPHPPDDLDLAVCAGRKLELDERLELMADLSQTLGMEVDLLDLWDAWGLIPRQAMTKGRIVLIRDRNLYASLIKRTLLDMADWGPLAERVRKTRVERFLNG